MFEVHFVLISSLLRQNKKLNGKSVKADAAPATVSKYMFYISATVFLNGKVVKHFRTT
jgi:hypothetical protein